MHTPRLGLFSLLLAASLGIDAVAARPNAAAITNLGVAADAADAILNPIITAGPAAVEAAATKTVVWSTVETSVTYPLWIGATVVTMVTSQTVTSLIPNAPAAGRTAAPGQGPDDGGDGDLVETVIGRTTYEFRLGYSDGHSSTSWSSATHSYVSTMGN